MNGIREVIAEARLGCTCLNDTIMGGERIKYARVDADHILKVIENAGYVVVPRNPTQAMIDSGYTHPGMCEPGDPEWVWQAMISAASEGK